MWLVSARGVIGAGSAAASPEIWSCGCWWRKTPDDDAPLPQGDLDGIAADAWDAWSTFIQAAASKFSENTWLTETRVYDYTNKGPAVVGGSSALQPARGIGYHLDETAVNGVANTNLMPLQCSVVASFYSQTRTKPRFGRMYLPPQGLPLGAFGDVQTSDQEAIIDGVDTLLSTMDTAFQATIENDVEAIIQSRGARTGQETMPFQPIRELRVGRIVDTQRRRRNALEEAYVVQDYP